MKKPLLLLLLVPALVLAVASIPSTKAEESSLQILKFEAEWCGPCQQMKPIFAKVSESFDSGVTFRSIDVDANRAFAERYEVQFLPTVVAVKEGREVGRSTGFMNERKLRSFVRKHH